MSKKQQRVVINCSNTSVRSNDAIVVEFLILGESCVCSSVAFVDTS